MERASAWAENQECLDWIDLELISTNEAADRLYRSVGFVGVGEVSDLYRIDGTALSYRSMVKRVAGRPTG
jgi:ribosomal protein S18 acetylase RimI-like enzyme